MIGALKRLFASSAMLLASGAGADSDGYYCAGPGYIAWETRGFHTDRVHRLHLITLDGASGSGPRQVLELPDFELHGLRCEAQSIDIYAYDSLHAIALVDGRLRYLDARTADDLAPKRDRYVARRFGDTPELTLKAHGNDTRFVLLTDLQRRKFTAGIEYITVARLVRLDLQQRLLDSQMIFAEAVAEPDTGGRDNANAQP